MTNIDLARRIEEIADRLEEQAERHQERARLAGRVGNQQASCYQEGLADAKLALSTRLREALTAPDPKPADHHTGTEDAAGRHMRQQPTGTEWLVAHKDEPDEPDEGEVA